MANDDDLIGLSPTVLQVLEKFVAAMRADGEIDGEGIDRLEILLQQGAVPKPDDIYTALFDPTPEDD